MIKFQNEKKLTKNYTQFKRAKFNIKIFLLLIEITNKNEFLKIFHETNVRLQQQQKTSNFIDFADNS